MVPSTRPCSGALEAETASFDEPAFQANLTRMLDRKRSDLMDLRLTDEQDQLVAAFDALYAKHAPPERVREVEPGGFDSALWEQLGELGAVPMAVDEAHGGWGASTLDLALVAEQHGRAAAPAPLIEAQVAARLLARVGSDRLDPVLDGERLVTLALHPSADGIARRRPGGRRRR